MAKVVPLCKQSKKAQKAYHDRYRGSWNGVCPVTRTIPSGKVYVRQQTKKEARRAWKEE